MGGGEAARGRPGRRPARVTAGAALSPPRLWGAPASITMEQSRTSTRPWLLRGRLGMPFQHRETVEEQGGGAVLLDVGESHVECSGRSPGRHRCGASPERSGPGLHHVAYGTDDIESALEAAREVGLRLIDERPRKTGIRRSRAVSSTRSRPAGCSPRSWKQRTDGRGDQCVDGRTSGRPALARGWRTADSLSTLGDDGASAGTSSRPETRRSRRPLAGRLRPHRHRRPAGRF